MDTFSRDKRHEIMAKVKSRNTLPEVLLRKKLHQLGYRYRIHDSSLPGKPDIVLKARKIVIFVNGCFWHGHKDCGRSRLPVSNREFWEDKISKNIRRDESNYNKLKEAGFDVIIIWSCEMKFVLTKVDEVVKLIERKQ